MLPMMAFITHRRETGVEPRFSEEDHGKNGAGLNFRGYISRREINGV